MQYKPGIKSFEVLFSGKGGFEENKLSYDLNPHKTQKKESES